MRATALAHAALTPQARLFVENYLETGEVVKSALFAGYSPKSATVQGSKLLRDPRVQAIISKIRARAMERTDVTVSRILAEYARIGFASLKNFIELDGDGTPHFKLGDLSDDEWAAIGEITTETFSEGKGKDARSVTRVKVKLNSKLDALEKMGKTLGMFDNHRGGGADDQGDVPATFTLKIGNANILIQPAGEDSNLRTTTAVPKAIEGVLRSEGSE